MKKIEVSMQEIYEAMRGNVHRNRRKYYRKEKHKKKRLRNSNETTAPMNANHRNIRKLVEPLQYVQCVRHVVANRYL